MPRAEVSPLLTIQFLLVFYCSTRSKSRRRTRQVGRRILAVHRPSIDDPEPPSEASTLCTPVPYSRIWNRAIIFSSSSATPKFTGSSPSPSAQIAESAAGETVRRIDRSGLRFAASAAGGGHGDAAAVPGVGQLRRLRLYLLHLPPPRRNQLPLTSVHTLLCLATVIDRFIMPLIF